MTWQKRVLDISVSVLLVVILFPILGVVIVVLLFTQGRPVLHVSERMRSPTEPFALVKLRTMPVVAGDSGVTGGNKLVQMSRLQRVLRRSRADELPQLWNVLRGLASLRFHEHEERLLRACTTAAQTDAIYRQRCIARKARLDAIYAAHTSVCFDIALIAQTAAKPFRRKD